MLTILQSGIDSIIADAPLAPVAAQAVPQQQEMTLSLIEMAAKGGWIMIVLAALSVIAIYISARNGGCSARPTESTRIS